MNQNQKIRFITFYLFILCNHDGAVMTSQNSVTVEGVRNFKTTTGLYCLSDNTKYILLFERCFYLFFICYYEK